MEFAVALLQTRLDRDVSGQKLCKGQEATETREIELLKTKGGALWGRKGRGIGPRRESQLQDD